ncbi:methylenetetrahydrofolate reductase [NAD(P)H] [Mariprofundus erugo]|uniref:methylenetetrahydrofolate reductase [NAD(P)H] n=1 Tax=Mariprofundus erugo TaxID=2528639 RepID=UPI0010FF0675|nr:methylenetetrahydrofolate reductase [NAD(P)H] [Mariprofundus erugo]TLS77664.1 methylenetetrahydrofolate reductase [NAD(P)H] [Mariprofundus erugo]
MKLSTILAAAERPLISCEFFPPKTDKGEENLWQCLKELQTINPAYISVTYGAGGTTQDRTKGIVTRIKQETGLSPVAHLTCVGASKDELAALLADYRAAGIENILALRGDAPEGMDRFEAVAGGFSHATDLIAFLREQGDFSIACATYPEGHPESKGGVEDDIRYLKLKQDNGADAAVTQYFFDNDAFFRFRDACTAAGVTLPIIPGIMPVGNFDQIVRFSSMCGATIPDWLRARMEPIREDLDAVKALGIELAAKQCRELLTAGVPGLHFYTLNKSEATIAIHNQLTDLL